MEKDRYYLSRAKYNTIAGEIEYMEGEGGQLLAKLLASSPGSGMGRPNDLPVHQLAGEFAGYLQEAKHVLSNSIIIDDLPNSADANDKIAVGWTVRVRYEGEETTEEYTILGTHEVDIPRGRISCRSPMGTTLIGRRKGDHVAFQPMPSSNEVRLVIEDARKLPLDLVYTSISLQKRLNLASSLIT